MRRALIVAALLLTHATADGQPRAATQAPSQPRPRSVAPAPAQALGTLRVTVVDQTGAVIVGANVTITGTDNTTRIATVPTAVTSDAGVATATDLAPGQYTIEASFPGFDNRVVPGVRVRAGDNRQVAVLPIKRVEAEVTVGQDRQQSAADRQGPTFGTSLTRDQIEALSDDPSTLQQQLQDMAGPGAVIRVDGFEGSALPAKAQIRSIRIARDQFAAEFHNAGGLSIEIITQPGLGPIRYNFNTLARDGDLSGRSPFVDVKGPERNINYAFNSGGTLIKDKSSFNLGVFGTNGYDTPNQYLALPDGKRISSALSLRTPRRNLFVNGQVDYALTLDQTLRIGFNRSHFSSDNAGVGGYNEPERAYSTASSANTVRVQHFGPVGRRAFSRSRAQVTWSDSSASSATEAATIRVTDAFTRGGAQRAGGDHSRGLDLGSDLDYVAGRHSFRIGATLLAGSYSSDSTSNYLGEYTFSTLDDYLAGRPSLFTRRIGDPRIAYHTLQAGVYFQDDIRVRRSLTISPGLRYELQAHVGDRADPGPRFGVTWAPFANGITTLRGSAGVFYDWLAAGTYDQAQRVDGLHQRELSIVNPTFPDPASTGVVPPINKYLLGDQFELPRITRVSAGVDQGIAKNTRIAATFSYQRGARLARGLNLNPIVNGIRPDQSFANVIEAVSDAASRQRQLQIDANVNPGALLPAFNGPRISFKRTTVFMNYTLASTRSNTDGAFAPPASGDPAGEWGPSTGSGFAAGPQINGQPFGPPVLVTDIRQRLNLQFNNQVVRNLLVGFSVTASSAPPYSLLTGRDDNGDGLFNDRPDGVGRNTLRATGMTTLNANIGYVFTFGPRSTLPPGVGVFGGGGALQVRTIDQSGARYRLQIFVQAQNLTNERNYIGYSGVLTSPFFGQPTAVVNMRKIDAGIALSF